jgi:serralysin
MATATNPYYIKALLSGSVWDNDQTGVTLNYMFFNDTPGYYSFFEYESDGFEAFTPLMETAVYEILGNISTLVNITFNEVFGVNQSKLGFGQARLEPGAAAWAYYPDPVDRAGGDVWVNTDYFSENDLGHGEYDYATLIHEIGHALGLKHSFESPNRLKKNEDNTQFTIMSYADSPFYGDLQPESFMLYDIAALQKLYGANMSHATGNDTYALLSGHIYTIWDAGGTDELDGSALAGSLVIDLNAGKYSSAGLQNNIAIAYNVTIENATGGSGNDTFTGNAGDNVIDGGGGTDTVLFAASILNFSFDFTGPATCIGHSAAFGDDTFIDIEMFSFTGSSWTFAQLETYFSDQVLTGTAGNDVLAGAAGDDILDGLGGADRMSGGAGSDTYYAGSTGDRCTEINGFGLDTVHASVNWRLGNYFENLVMEGGALKGTGNGLANAITGNALGNSISGGTGSDVIDGGGGLDILTGGGGADIFVFRDATAYDAVDVVKDFRLAQHDALDLRDMLSGYDPLTDALSDFVQVAVVGNASRIFVDADGAAGGFAPSQIAALNGVKLNADVDALALAGTLLVS